MYTEPARAATRPALARPCSSSKVPRGVRAPKPAVDDVSREIGAGGFIGVIARSTGSRRQPRGASASAESMLPACRAASRGALCDDIPAVQSGWQARRADPRPDRPPQPHADVARGTPALVGRGQGVHVFRARAVRHRPPRRATRRQSLGRTAAARRDRARSSGVRRPSWPKSRSPRSIRATRAS
jgi:hypothetical protein